MTYLPLYLLYIHRPNLSLDYLDITNFGLADSNNNVFKFITDLYDIITFKRSGRSLLYISKLVLDNREQVSQKSLSIDI